jgi:F plasmid transfer operon, TraF, protein
MGRSSTGTLFAFIIALLTSVPAAAQSFETLGTRAAGMGGAFVAVADDASAVYWNPAGLALGGSYFSLILDNNQGKAEPDDVPQAGDRSATMFAFTTLPVGLSYYRLTASTLTPTGDPRTVRLDRLTTHHLGVTLVQSVTDRIAVASTLKWVRGYAASGIVPDGDRDDLLDGAGELPDADTSKFDADLGIMASFGAFRAGLTVRNTTEPDFSTGGGEPVTLKRQTRAGFSYVGLPSLILATDVDVERAAGSLGDVRDVAAGAEARLIRRVSVRSGVRFNTLGDEPGGHAPVYSLGTSVAAYRQLLVDAQVTFGSRAGDRGWGIAARLVY